MFDERERRKRELKERTREAYDRLYDLLREETTIDRECTLAETEVFKSSTFEQQTDVLKRKDLTPRQAKAFAEVYVLHGTKGFKVISKHKDLVLKHSALFTDSDISCYYTSNAFQHSAMYFCVCFLAGIITGAVNDFILTLCVWAFIIIIPFVYMCVYDCRLRAFVREVRARESQV